MSGEPKIVLCMIVRNESQVLARCLNAAAAFIDAAAICDTGSDDGTPELAAATLQQLGIPHRIHRHPWVSFGHNRSRAFQASRALAEELGWDLAHAWALFLDADMVPTATPGYNRRQLRADSHQVRFGNEAFWYYLTVFARLALPWRSVGATHEYWAAEGAGPGERLEGFRIIHYGDGGTRWEKFERDIRLLEAELREEPENSRAMFYLAQSYFDIGRYAEAREWYLRRVAAGGWEEEAWFAAYKAGCCLLKLEQWDLGVGELLAAWQRRPQRAEPLFQIAHEARVRGKHAIGMLAAEKALQIPPPADDLLFIDGRAHAAGPVEEISICAYYTGQKTLGQEACEALLHSYNAGAAATLAARNLTYYVPALTLEGTHPLHLAPGPTPEPPLHAATALARTVHGYLVLGWAGAAELWQRLELDFSTNVVATTPLDTSRAPGPLDDLRLVRGSDAWWFVATDRRTAAPVLGRLDAEATRIEHLVALRLPHADDDATPHRLLPLVQAERLYLIAGFSPLVVLDVDQQNGSCREVLRSVPPLNCQRYRGSGAPASWGERYLLTVHEAVERDGRTVHLHRFVELDRDFALTRVSHAWVFQQVAEERVYAQCLSHDGQRLIICHASETVPLQVSAFATAHVEQLLHPVDALTPALDAIRRRRG
ncbi:MAG: hypothetical protein DCC58_13255 [Chloroflexi bacterium]|nr:MAG: hypothetical protein DCC58_13255 [Chloroflexota bacterium]